MKRKSFITSAIAAPLAAFCGIKLARASVDDGVTLYSTPHPDICTMCNSAPRVRGQLCSSCYRSEYNRILGCNQTRTIEDIERELKAATEEIAGRAVELTFPPGLITEHSHSPGTGPWTATRLASNSTSSYRVAEEFDGLRSLRHDYLCNLALVPRTKDAVLYWRRTPEIEVWQGFESDHISYILRCRFFVQR